MMSTQQNKCLQCFKLIKMTYKKITELHTKTRIVFETMNEITSN